MARLACACLIACGATSPPLANRDDTSAPGLPAWPLAIEPGLAADCQPAGMLRARFPSWHGDVCGVLLPSASAGEHAAAEQCVDAHLRDHRPFVLMWAERIEQEVVGYAYLGYGGDVYRAIYLADPCAQDAHRCVERGNVSLVRCNGFRRICAAPSCYACSGDLIASCVAKP